MTKKGHQKIWWVYTEFFLKKVNRENFPKDVMK